MWHSLIMCNTQRLSLVHAEDARSLAITVAFWPILPAMAPLAVNFIHMNSNSCAVQALVAIHCTNRQIHMHTHTNKPILLFCICAHVSEHIHVFR